MTGREDQRDRWNEMLEGISLSDGCSSCLAMLFCIALIIFGCMTLWISCTTPSEPPYKWDPSVLKGMPGFGPTPTPLPSESWLP